MRLRLGGLELLLELVIQLQLSGKLLLRRAPEVEVPLGPLLGQGELFLRLLIFNGEVAIVFHKVVVLVIQILVLVRHDRYLLAEGVKLKAINWQVHGHDRGAEGLTWL